MVEKMMYDQRQKEVCTSTVNVRKFVAIKFSCFSWDEKSTKIKN
uniref:Uncharacterized protein n=1 Tax=Amphimedon queenslandica TaxID=400682 RepID=A0A1X7SHP9_AMPQE